jgi:hypothetical protein
MTSKKFHKNLFRLSIALILFSACEREPYLSLPPAVPDQSFIEEFDTVASAIARGWRFENRSEPVGKGDWIQAYSNRSRPYALVNAKKTVNSNNYLGSILPAYSSRSNNTGYITTSCYASAGTLPQGGGVISNWVISPIISMQNGDKIIFYTTAMDSVYSYDNLAEARGESPNVLEKVNVINRLQVRINLNDTSTECGRGVTPGLFDFLLLDINPSYSLTAFPYFPVHGWTRLEAIVTGLKKPTRGRFAFRYFIEGGGPGSSEKGSIVNLDKIQYISSK